MFFLELWYIQLSAYGKTYFQTELNYEIAVIQEIRTTKMVLRSLNVISFSVLIN